MLWMGNSSLCICSRFAGTLCYRCHWMLLVALPQQAKGAKDDKKAILLSSQFWPIPSMSRGVITSAKLCLSHPFGRIMWIREWAVDRDPVLTSTTSAKLGKTAINNAFAVLQTASETLSDSQDRHSSDL